ncbi:CDP-glucose 4,6-dehydratase [Achromobacter aloeverae]|uniref:CDP-glucose 4,6-dehydratase n=1 Tax=Achromobacter aloeverae TaxID=1750518 RepID=A0A4Q1HJ20_9BURK|nr:CDP-glucose 4,6-dehydratase [Achromobacter aloeverae]
MNPEFWNGRRVFLTGHTGFKGSWMALWLQSLGADVTGFALAPPTHPNLFDIADVARGLCHHVADIRNADALHRVMAECKPDVVIHMAAQPLVRYSYDEPVETYATNVMGTVHLLEAVRRVGGVRAVVNITTDKCYENREWIWGYRENEPMGGYDPYSNSKGCAELVSAAYRSSFFNPADYARHGVAVATVRAGNVIGGGDWAKDRLIPDILAAFEAGQAVHIRNPGAIRPWQHVLEPLRGYLMLAERLVEAGPEFGGAWNFGPHADDARPVGWIVERMGKLWGAGARWEVDNGQHPHEAHFLRLDITKAMTQLGWYPALRLETALQRIIEWSRARMSGADMRQVTLAQIQAYQATATQG